jgi:extracellular elastinolytic metalloproteinase
VRASSRHSSRSGRFAVWTALLAVLVLALAATTGAGAAVSPPSSQEAFPDVDNRAGTVAPTAAQLAAVQQLHASVRWNRFGTPKSLIRHEGFLAQGLRGTSAASVAKAWIDANRTLFRLSSTTNLVLLHDAKLGSAGGHAVLFGQRFAGLRTVQDGTITVGVIGSEAQGWKVAYASSSLTSSSALNGSAQITPARAWVNAALNVGRSVSLANVQSTQTQGGWNLLSVAGFSEPQRARLRSLPTPTGGVIPVWETYVVQPGGDISAYKHYVDARNGAIVVRQNLVHQVHQSEPVVFNGDLGTADGACGPNHGFTVPANTISLDVVATADLPANDIVLILKKGGTTLQSADTATSPEAIHYEPPGGVPAGADYAVQVCEFVDGAGALPPTTYTGTIAVNDVAGTTPFPYPPKWKVFPANPPLSALAQNPWNNPSTDTRKVWCWDAVVQGVPIPGCNDEVQNSAARVPWDFNTRTNSPTFTTVGNAANASESWFLFRAPGATGFRPFSAQRDYSYPWANDWYARDCAPDNFVPGSGYDISAATTNLFAMHNRMHDWSYHLGFTEENWNLQLSNFGNGGAENDPVLGAAQAGAADGGFPAYNGRDNANMTPLPDGVSPITNMYLWQPIAGAFYPPCVDGDYDMSIIGHEYGHAIENRMIGKGGTRAGHHAGAMGESNGDLNAVEILNEYGFVPTGGENPFAVGAYATGNKQRAIRNYGMNFPRTGAYPTPGVYPQIDPLNFSDIGYDITGAQVHADGEIWSATNYDIRQALVAKYNASHPASNRALQRDCAEGRRPAGLCPGNRRWIQIVYDAYLLMPTDPSMLDARDAYLAADRIRFGGANQNELWLAFARRGFGQRAFSTNTAAESPVDPKPDFSSPKHANATVTFNAVASNSGNSAVRATIFVGHYEARTSPVADTDPATSAPLPTGSANTLDAVTRFAPGTYEFVAQARGYGQVRFRKTFAAGATQTVTVSMPTNLASRFNGAEAAGDGENHGALIDDTEATNWQSIGVPVRGRQVTVDLAGDVRQFDRVKVSALLTPGQSRFTALRQFEIWTCNASVANAGCTLPTGFTKRYTSPANAFPGVPPRPAGPDLIIRNFTLPATFSATHVRIVVLTNQCTGNSAFQGEQDADPTNSTDCRTGSVGSPIEIIGDLGVVPGPKANEVQIAELEVFLGSGGA